MTKKIMMILSPAKTLDMTSPLPPHFLAAAHRTTTTQPECSPETTLAVATRMKALSKAQIKTTLKISDALAVTTQAYWRDFGAVVAPAATEETTTTTSLTNNNNDNDEPSLSDDAAAKATQTIITTKTTTTIIIQKTKPCIFAYSGAAYQGLDAVNCDIAALDYLQDRLRILSAVYGCLRPYDHIHPYRLEMGTKGIIPLSNNNNDESLLSCSTTTATTATTTAAKKKNKKKTTASSANNNTSMADVWRGAVTAYLAKDLQAAADQKQGGNNNQNDSAALILLNLASDEYAAAVDVSKLVAGNKNVQFIKIVFLEPTGKVVTIHTKRARGLMVRYLAEHQIETLAQIQTFHVEGYRYDEARSDETTLVFQRTKQQPPGPSKEAAPKKRRADTTTQTTTTTTTKQKKKKKTTT